MNLQSMLISTRRALLPAAGVFLVLSTDLVADDAPNVQGKFIVNGSPVDLPYVYVWRKKEGFHNPEDPSWTILFVGRPLMATEIGDPVWDAAYIEIGVTETSEYSDNGPQLEVYSQSIRFSADAGGNVSGGTYPEFELDGLADGAVNGHLWQKETQEFFDDEYIYDLSFNTPISDPDAPIGEVLPPGGGEPGAAYLKWVETLQQGDLDALLAIVPEDLAEDMRSVSREEAEEQIAFMRMMTPTDVKILGGSSDGEVATLNIEGQMDGDTVTAEITLNRMGDHWVPTKTSM